MTIPCRALCRREATRTCPFCTVCLGKLGDQNRLRLASAINAVRLTGSAEAQAHYTQVMQDCVTHLTRTP